jgi:hypothetical protein
MNDRLNTVQTKNEWLNLTFEESYMPIHGVGLKGDIMSANRTIGRANC